MQIDTIVIDAWKRRLLRLECLGPQFGTRPLQELIIGQALFVLTVSLQTRDFCSPLCAPLLALKCQRAREQPEKTSANGQEKASRKPPGSCTAPKERPKQRRFDTAHFWRFANMLLVPGNRYVPAR
jgi:hypothetical protein